MSLACETEVAGWLAAVLAVLAAVHAQIEPRISSRQRPTNVERPQFRADRVRAAFSRARSEVEVRHSQERGTTTGRRLDLGVHGAEARHQLFLFSRTKSIRLEGIQERFEQASIDLAEELRLNRDQVVWDLPEAPLEEVTNEVSECEAEFNGQCDRNRKYRTADGSCNNVRNPSWGRSFACFRRLLPAAYGNSVNSPRQARSGQPLPPVRDISLRVHRHIDRPARQYTHLFMVFGQFLDHDITLTPLTRTQDNLLIQCCPDNDHSQCLPIALRPDDPFFGQFGQTCMNFVRSTLCPTCKLGEYCRYCTISG
ncbi:hypothetical protein LAZ67_2006518 [Cordylochernes scorpioides]|uniref:Uncharacterized protein n=1 Tax=Cordylochernes scorpioides TaxID=51811 RepID=A0ABY6K5K8_9ARAC|nr:hypothetical protein LAZ67_2006518 [Cordylochernes scorpioides]